MLASGMAADLAPENAGDVTGEPQCDLHSKQREQYRLRAVASCGVAAMALESGNRQPVHHAEDHAGSDEVREKTNSRMAEGRAHDELQPHGSDSQHGKRGEAGANIRTNDCGRRLHPALAGEEGNADHDAEKVWARVAWAVEIAGGR